jgi:predicted metalloprotease with PDZ domain
MSAAAASFDAWIKLYRPDENSVNSAVSYYEKGHLLGALLDLEVRLRSGGKHGLDQVAREVHRRGKQGIGEAEMAAALKAATGSDFTSWLERHVHGTAELPFVAALRAAGLALEAKEGAKAAGGALGVSLRASGGRLTLASVLRGGAGDRGGLSAGDEVLALDGARVDEGSLRDRLAAKKPGERVRLTVFRDDLLREVEVELGAAPRRRRAALVRRPSAEQRARLDAWLGEDAVAELEKEKAAGSRS